MDITLYFLDTFFHSATQRQTEEIMSQKTLSQIIVHALTCTDKPEQPAGFTFDSDILEIIGSVPLPVQHLSCAAHELSQTLQTLHQTVDFANAAGDTKQVAQTSQEIKRLQEQLEILSQLSLGLFHEYFPPQGQNYDDMVIVENWQLAGVVKAQEFQQIQAEVIAILSGLDGTHTDSAEIYVLRPSQN